MARPLPFPAYSWQISQHEIAFTRETTTALLGAAQQFEGLAKSEYSRPLNEFIVSRGILTANIRENVPSPWRDYQQVLAELGLIVSTKLTRRLEITEVGRAYLAGNLPFPVMLTERLLRYQYPNGQKQLIGGQSFVAACGKYGISVRPAVTLLKLLCRLSALGRDNLSVDEILAFVLPNRTDKDWEISLKEIMTGKPSPTVPLKTRRNVSAWINLLGKTTLFRALESPLTLTLSIQALQQLSTTEALADELLSTPMWVPRDDSAEERTSWFRFFGSATVNPNFENAFAGDVDPDQYSDFEEDIGSYSGTVVLQGFTELDTTVQLSQTLTGDDLLASMMRGMDKRAFSKAEHDSLVNRVANLYRSKGYDVFHDPSSVDLLAVLDDKEDIIEVKTVNPKNIGKQVRAAFGQVLEYDFRLPLQNAPKRKRLIVLSREISPADWRRNFCNRYSIDLVSMSELESSFSN